MAGQQMGGMNAVAPGAYAASGMDYQQGLRAQSMPLQPGGGLGGLGGMDLKGQLSSMAMGMLQKQLNPPQHAPMAMPQAMPIFGGIRPSPSLSQLYPGLQRYG